MKAKIIDDPYGHNITSSFDARLRFHDTIVKIDNIPHLLLSEGDTLKISVFKSKETGLKLRYKKDIRELEMNTNFANLGWSNTGMGTIYLERSPVRGSKQGLHKNNLQYYKIQGSGVKKQSFESTSQILPYIDQDYSKINLSSLRDRSRIALSHEIALSKSSDNEYNIYFNLDVVGKYNKKGGKTTIFNPELVSIIEYTLGVVGL